MNKTIITQLYNEGIKLHPLAKHQKKPQTKGRFIGVPLPKILKHEGNVGVICGELSGIVVLDLDNHAENQRTGEQVLHDLLAKLNETLPETYTVLTPTGGKHIYLRLPKRWYGTRFHPKLEDYPQIDFRNNNQYIVAESSHLDYNDEEGTHVYGDYVAEGHSTPTFIAYAPDWLLELYMKNINPSLNKPRQLNDLGALCNLWGLGMKEPVANFNQAIINKMVLSGVKLSTIKRLSWYVNQTSVKDTKVDFINAYDSIMNPIKAEGIELVRMNRLGEFLTLWFNGAGEGGRNIYMTSMVGRLFASGMKYDYVYDIARVINRTACNPPLDHDEFNLIYNSMLRTEKRRLDDIKRRLEHDGKS